MKVQNTQIPTPQPSVETMVGNVTQEFPKPSIPPEEMDYSKAVSDDEKSNKDIHELSQNSVKETEKDVKEFNVKASQQDAIESLKEFKELQETLNKQKGMQTYTESMGFLS